MGGRRADVAKARLWRDVLRRQRASGLSVRGFCLREGLSEPGFYWWRRRLARRAAPASKPHAAAGRKSAAWRGRRPTTQFVPLTVIPAVDRPLIEIALPGGMTIRLHEGAAGPLLGEVLTALVVEPRKPAGRTAREPRPC